MNFEVQLSKPFCSTLTDHPEFVPEGNKMISPWKWRHIEQKLKTENKFTALCKGEEVEWKPSYTIFQSLTRPSSKRDKGSWSDQVSNTETDGKEGEAVPEYRLLHIFA